MDLLGSLLTQSERSSWSHPRSPLVSGHGVRLSVQLCVPLSPLLLILLCKHPQSGIRNTDGLLVAHRRATSPRTGYYEIARLWAISPSVFLSFDCFAANPAILNSPFEVIL